MSSEVAQAIRDVFQQPVDSEPQTITEAVGYISAGLKDIARAIDGGGSGDDATGGHVRSLTEAVMGMTAGLVRIAESIGDLADAIRDHDKPIVTLRDLEHEPKPKG